MELIGWKQLLWVALILGTVAIVVTQRDQFTSGKVVLIGLMTLGSVLLFLSTVFQFRLGFVDLELAAMIVWMASLGVGVWLFSQGEDMQTDV